MRLYTRHGDDGYTRLRFGRPVSKNSPHPTAYGGLDEAQAVLGLARAETKPDTELHDILTSVCRDLWIVMAELATDQESRSKLTRGKDSASEQMVKHIEQTIDVVIERFEAPKAFTIPGENRLSALLDLARTVVRRAERDAVSLGIADSFSVPYLNRLADLLWALARWTEQTPLLARDVGS